MFFDPNALMMACECEVCLKCEVCLSMFYGVLLINRCPFKSIQQYCGYLFDLDLLINSNNKDIDKSIYRFIFLNFFSKNPI